MSFAGKTVIVTGGNGGIGQGIVETFSEYDANVVIADIGEALSPPVNQGAGRIVDVRTDITNRESVDAMIARAMAEFGRIDVLINNAGRGEGVAKLPDVTRQMVDWMVELNIVGTVNCTQAAVAEMMKTGGGSIVNISSNAGLSGMSGRNDPVYAGVKGFINSFGKALAAGLGEANIRVNTVAPGWIVPEKSGATSTNSFWNTMKLEGSPEDFHAAYAEGRGGSPHNPGATVAPLHRLGTPRDIAYACLYFAADAARFTTGQVLSIGGGNYMPS
jgi:NAD(P)-dependent dehydrogenase (short-subunit alcohol dehydrogenase family)